MKKIYFSIFLAFSIISAFAQQQVFTKVFFNENFGISAYSAMKLPDYQFAIIGTTGHPLILKLDTAGDLVWSREYINDTGFSFEEIVLTDDDCFVLGGMFGLLVKMNLEGENIWTKNIQFEDPLYFHGITTIDKTFDQGIIASGILYEGSINAINYVPVIKFDSLSNIEWLRVLQCPDMIFSVSTIKQLPDSGYLVLGTNQTTDPPQKKPFLIKISPEGELEWSKLIDFESYDFSKAIDFQIVEDGCFLLCNTDAYATIIQIDFAGNFQWAKRTSLPSSLWNIDSELTVTPDSCLLIAGNAYSEGGMIKLDFQGNCLFGQNHDLYSLSALEAEDGGYFVIGNGPLSYGLMEGTNNEQIGIIKSDSTGNSSDCVTQIGCNCWNEFPVFQPYLFVPTTKQATISSIQTEIIIPEISNDPGCVAVIGGVGENPSESLKLSVYPNPSDGIFQVGINKQDISGFTSLAIFNIMGEKVFETTDHRILGSAIDLRAQPRGIYFVRCQMDEVVLSGRIVISKK